MTKFSTIYLIDIEGYHTKGGNMDYKNIVEQRNTYKDIVMAAKEAFGKYKVDFDYIKNSDSYISELSKKYKLTWPKGIGIFFLGHILGWLVSLVIGFDVGILMGIAAVIIISKNSKSDFEKKKNKVLSEVARRFNILKKEHDEFEHKEILHIKYVSPDITDALYNYFDEGRADNLKEAINLMHSEMQSNEMLKKQEELLSGLNSASKTNTVMGVATVAAVVLSGAATRSTIRN